jgi:hypothetical protein
MQLGKMYLVKEYFWFLFPTKELAAEGAPGGGGGGEWRTTRRWAYHDAKVLSERYNCNVAVVEENTYVVLLEVDNDYLKLLDCNGNIGWISYWAFSNHFEFVKE